MSAVSELSVLLVDDDAIVRDWVRVVLEDAEFRIAGEAGTTLEALALLERRRPDLVLVDYRLRDRVGIDLVRELRRHNPTLPAVLMTANPERGFNEVAREAGARGTLLKTGSAADLLSAMRGVMAGADSFDPRFPKRPAGQAALSPREREVMRLVAAGATNRDIAAGLGISGETVKTLIGRTFAKLGAHKRAEAVSAAHDLGLL